MYVRKQDATSHCVTCQQPLHHVREGARLTALKARIFDLIRDRPGITRRELAGIIYGEVTEARMFTIGSHANQIREKLEIAESCTTIKGTPLGGYVVDPSMNGHNRKLLHKKNRTGFSGVFLLKSGRFRANCCIRNKQLYLGTFDTAQEAFAIREAFRIKHNLL